MPKCCVQLGKTTEFNISDSKEDIISALTVTVCGLILQWLNSSEY